MSTNTGIEWTDATWNPIRGCSRVSEGCRHCYAETVANRFCGPGKPYEGVVQIGVDGKGNGKWNGQIKFVEKHLLDPLRWNPIRNECQACGTDHLPKDCDRGLGTRPRRIFVNSMSDLFHENVTDEMRDRIFAVMAHCSVEWYRCTKRECDHGFCDENYLRLMRPHTFQVLTKRPERMLQYLRYPNRREAILEAWNSLGWYFTNAPVFDSLWPLPNVQLGVSVENQKAADERIPLLLQTPAAVRFLSCEPLLGKIDINEYLHIGPEGGHEYAYARREMLHWVIVGGESGPGARPMHPDWARSLRDQCVAAGVPFFFKQWGEWRPCGNEPNRTEWCDGLALVNSYNGDIRGSESLSDETTEVMRRTGKKIAGAELDGREWREMPR